MSENSNRFLVIAVTFFTTMLLSFLICGLLLRSHGGYADESQNGKDLARCRELLPQQQATVDQCLENYEVQSKELTTCKYDFMQLSNSVDSFLKANNVN